MTTYVPPRKNTAFVFYISLVSQASSPDFQANPTLADGDAKVAIDDAPPANLATLPAVDADFTKRVKVSLSADEMNGDNISVIFSDDAGAEWHDLSILLQTATQQVDDLASQASVNTIGGYLDTEIAAILADTNELQTDWANGGRLDLILDAVLAMLDNARAEPGQGNPPVNPDAMTKIDYLYKAWRNKKTETATVQNLYDDAGSTIDQKRTLSDDGTTLTVSEMATGA